VATLPFNYYDLLETFPLGGCALCRLVEQDVARFLDSYLYEYANEPETHAAFRAGRGLCAQHSRDLVGYGASVLGIAILHSQALDEVLVLVAGNSKAGAFSRLFGSNSGLADRLEADGPCMACKALERSERLHLQTLVTHLGDVRIEAAYRESEGLCLPHFRMALRTTPDAGRQELLARIQTAHWAKLKAQLDEFARKYDINHAAERMGAEGDSWRRATEMVAGRPAVFGLRK
jgi:hypothetical protein